ncbi:MAG: hypothetical protein ABIA59_03855 [Candidatus Latescibacterota bacterium]
MKKALLLAICLLTIASMAFAQAGSIGVYADPMATVCNLTDTAPGLKLVYVVHVASPGATAAQFSIDEVHAMTYLAEAVTAPYIKIGTCAGPAGFGCAIAYGMCKASPNMIITLQYFASGLTAPCGYFRVVEDFSAGKTDVLTTDCASPPNLLIATGGMAFINNNGSCPCDVPVEETSWGQIKSLYQ